MLTSGLCNGSILRGSIGWSQYGSDDIAKIGSTGWTQYNSDGIYVDVDTVSCGFTATPIYGTSMGEDPSHWTSPGGSELDQQRAAGFRIYAYKSGIMVVQSNSWKWHINWMAAQAPSSNIEKLVQICQPFLKSLPVPLW